MWLRNAKTCDAEINGNALLDWFPTFALVSKWNSDQLSHFKNGLMVKLANALSAKHSFTTTYNLQSNNM